MNQRTLLAISFLFALFFISPNQNFAQNTSNIPSEQLKGLKYRLIGPHRGGRVSTVAGVPQEPYTFYMGATGGGVWKTTDAGTSWKNISDGYFSVGSIGAIAVAASDPNVIYVGTGSPDLRGNVSIGKGIYKSTDGGDTWKLTAYKTPGQISKIEIHPSDPNVAYAAVLGNPFGPNKERGVYRTKDGGETWEKVHYVNDNTGAIDLVLDVNNPRNLFAGMWTAERKPWTFIDGSEDSRVWKSNDGGDTWKEVKGLPDGLAGRIGLAISPVNSKKVWVLQEAKEEKKGGIYRSDDGGNTWKRINRDHSLRQRAWYYSRIFADTKDENTVYVMNVSMFKSIDGGKTFERIRTPHSDNHALWINPDNPKIMVQGNDGGANISFNGGATWTTQFNQPTSEFYRVTVDNQFPYRVYGAQQDNSTITVPSRTEGGQSALQDWYFVGGGESGHIAVDPRDPDVIYAGTYIGQITRKDRKKGFQRNINAYPQMHDGVAPRDIRYRFQWNAPIRLSPHNPDILYHCSQFVHKSLDGGKSWEIISPDLTTNKDEYQDIPGKPIQYDHTGVELYTTIFAFEESPDQAGELWAGSDDGLLHISKDGGANWENITPSNMPVEGTINNIDLSSHQAGRALVSVYKYRDNDFRPYIFLTNDYGQNWKLLTNGRNGIPSDHFVRVVKEDPIRKGLLFAGTEFGMYYSFDEGANWQAFQFNLPITPITDLVIKDNDLVLATQGRSFWIMDDISPLRKMTNEIAENELHLFEIQDAYRSQLSNFRGGASPDRAPNGALIYFNLKEKVSSSNILKMSILDHKGKVRRTFSTKPDVDKKEERLKATKGLNRFEWNLKYEGPTVQSGARFSLANTGGVNAPTGAYSVILELKSEDGETLAKEEAKGDLKKDPRWVQSDEDLMAQYQLSNQIKETLTECHDAIGKLRSVRKQIKEISKRAKKANLTNEIEERGKVINDKLTEIEDQLIQSKSESGQDPINYPPMLDDQIAYLYSVCNAQDDRPTDGVYERYEDLKKELSVYLNQLETIWNEEIPAFNRYLGEQGVTLIMF